MSPVIGVSTDFLNVNETKRMRLIILHRVDDPGSGSGPRARGE